MSIYRSESGKQQILETYAGILRVWPVPNKQYSVDTAYGSTFVIESGNTDKPAMLLLHGSLSNSFTWFSDVILFSENYHVFAVDLIGEPGFSAESRPSYTSEAYEQWMGEVMKRLGVSTCTMVGLSLGGWMALRYATIYPENIDKMILLCPGGLAPVKEDFLEEVMRRKDNNDQSDGKMVQKVMLNNAEDEGMKKVLEYVTLIGKQTEPRTETLPVFSDSELSKLTMPVLIIFGDSDILLRADESIENLKRNAADVRSVILPNTGHAVVGQAQRIMEFLNE